MKKILIMSVILAVVAACLPARGVTIWKLSEQEKAERNANWGVNFTYADLTESTTNTAQSFTNTLAVLAKQSVRFVSMQLDTAFDGGSSLFTNSTTLIVGDGTDDDLYLASTELNADGTEVWYKHGRPNGGTIAITPQTATITTTVYTIQSADIGSNGAAVVTNILAAGTVKVVATNAVAVFTPTEALGYKVYTANDYVDFKFTPGGDPTTGQALNMMTAGSVTLFFDIQETR